MKKRSKSLIGLTGWGTGVASSRKSEDHHVLKNHHSPRNGYSFYTFIAANRSADEWKFCTLRGETVNCSDNCIDYFAKITPEMVQLWKRVVLDQAINFDDYTIDPMSLRLVKIAFDAIDATSQLFTSKTDYDYNKTMAAVGRLGDQESKLLGLEKKRAVYKLMRRGDFDDDDTKLLEDLVDQNETEVAFSDLLNHLSRNT